MPTTGDCQLGASEGRRSTCQVTASFLDVSSIFSWVKREGGDSILRCDEKCHIFILPHNSQSWFEHRASFMLAIYI